MNNKYFRTAIFILAVFHSISLFAESIDVRPVKQYPNTMSLGWQYSIELDCSSKEESFISSYDELNKVVIEHLKTHDIEDNSNAPIALNISITDFSCDKNGLHDEFISPLSLYASETTTAAVILKVNFEIERKETSQILHSQEIVVISNNEEKEGHFMWFFFDKKVREVSLKTAWNRTAEQIVNKTKKVLKNA